MKPSRFSRSLLLILCLALSSSALLFKWTGTPARAAVQASSEKIAARLAKKRRLRQTKQRGKQPVAPLKTSPAAVSATPIHASESIDETSATNIPGPDDEVSQSRTAGLLRSKRERARYDQPAEREAFHRLKRVPEGEVDVPVERYFEAHAHMEAMPHFSSERGRFLERSEVAAGRAQLQGLGTWTSLGPGNIGGRTRAVIIHPQDPNIIYAAGVAGGVWKTTNGGGTWIPMSDLLANIAVNSLAMDPKDPKILYAGTGEGYFAVDNVRGAGIFKTTDSGATWTRLASTAGNTNFFYVNDLIVSPVNSERLYAATRTGVWRSIDAGVTWTRELVQTVTGGCLDLAARSDQMTDYLFAACGTLTKATIYRNTDASGTATWTSVFTEVGMGRTVLAIAPSNQATIYAVSTSYLSGQFEDALHAVFRSTASGDSGSWTTQVSNTNSNKLNTAILSSPALALASDCGFALNDDFFAQGWYDLALAVDPVDPNIVWVGGIDLFRSDDAGLNWGVASNAYVESTFSIHPDQHVILFHPQYNGTTNQTMFVANDGGIFRTLNSRAAVAKGSGAACGTGGIGIIWNSLNRDYGVTQFYHGLPSPDGTQFFGGTQDNGTLRGTTAGGANGWHEINGGDGGYVGVDPRNPMTLYAEFTGMSMRKSTDGGATFGDSTFGIEDFGLFITPFSMDPSDGNRLWTGGAFIWRTLNGAAQWTVASQITAGVGSVSALAVAPTDANIALVGMSDGFLLRTDRALISTGSTLWPFTRPRTGYVSWVAFDPNNKSIAYATYATFGGAHVWRSSNGGVTWASIDGTGMNVLPDVPVHAIAVDPSNTARLYIGTDVGVFVSTDGGANWAIENTGFANVVTEAIALNVVNGVTQLFAFTHGRGAWRVNVNNAGCEFGLEPASRSLSSTAASGTINVKALPAGCNWTATSNATWLAVSGGGSTSGVANYSVQKNDTVARRAATATIAGRAFSIVQEGVLDDKSPVVRITTPNPAGVVVNTTGVINVGGTATDNGTIVRVSWSNDRGGSGTAVGTANWSITSVALLSGLNSITISATDDVRNVGRATLVVKAEFGSVITTIAGTGARAFSGDNGQAVLANLNRPVRMAYDKAGNLVIADSENHRIRRVALNGTITTIVGTGVAGYNGDDIQASTARLNFPIGIALDDSDNIFIVDNNNNRIRKVTAASGVITTVAGNGSSGDSGEGGAATAATFNEPQNVVVDTAGNLYISDIGNHKVKKVTGGMIATIAGTGTAGFSGEGGLATAAQLNGPNNVSLDSAGNIYICDAENSRIRRITISNGFITTIVGTGTRGFGGDNGQATNASINSPVGAIVDAAGNLFFSDRGNHRLRRVDGTTRVITTLAGTGIAGYNGDGISGLQARLNAPSGLAFGPGGRIILADRDNSRIRQLTLLTAGDTVPPNVVINIPVTTPTFTTANSPINLAGTASDANSILQVRWTNDRGGSGQTIGTTAWVAVGIGLLAGVNRITITAFDFYGNAGQAVLEVSYTPQNIIITSVGKGTFGSTTDGVAGAEAQLRLPGDVDVGPGEIVYIADSGNHTIWRVGSDGKVLSFAGNGGLGSSGDGGLATLASLNMPCGLAVTQDGIVYISDTLNHRVRKVMPDGKISTIAGDGMDEFKGDGGSAVLASLNLPIGVAVDTAGNVYIADAGNGRIRKVTVSDGKIATIAGNGQVGFTGDGNDATAARLNFPTGVAVDQQGNVYIADLGNARIRRVGTDAKITTVVGTGIEDFGGDNGPATSAQINQPYLVRTDSQGVLYIADSGNQRVRKYTPANGLITTIAGNGEFGSAGDGGSPTSAELALPSGIGIDSTGSVYIADYANNRIRRIVPLNAVGSVISISGASFSLSIGMAAESIAAGFGPNLALGVDVAATIPLPTSLLGTTVLVKDSTGAERLAPLFFVSAQQVNFYMPPGTSNGTATITITSGDGRVTIGVAQIGTVAPGIFTASSDGQGVAAAQVFRVRSDGSSGFENIATFDTNMGKWVPIPIDLGPATDEVFLVLFGTGWRFNSGLSNVKTVIAGVTRDVLFAGQQPSFVGVDQINVKLDRSLIGSGVISVSVIADGKTTNTVTIQIK